MNALSHNEAYAQLMTTISALEHDFSEICWANDVSFRKEAEYAIQALKKNKYIFDTAQSNPTSLEHAIKNVAGIGVSLNPALQHAFLIPRCVNRVNQICFDVSYRGLIHLATRHGGIDSVDVKIVHANDTFVYNGFGKAATHQIAGQNLFTCDRGEPVGCAIHAMSKTGEIIVGWMTKDEIYHTREHSESYKAYLAKKISSSPWVSHELEMWKKTVVKRESKLWPSCERMHEAASYLNEQMGEGLDQRDVKDISPCNQQQVETITLWLETYQKEAKSLIQWINKQMKTEYQALSDMTSEHADWTINAISNMRQS